MYNQQYYDGYSQGGGYPQSYNPYNYNYNKGGTYGTYPNTYPDQRYNTYGQGGYNYAAKPYPGN